MLRAVSTISFIKVVAITPVIPIGSASRALAKLFARDSRGDEIPTPRLSRWRLRNRGLPD
jgi:hypothetical protein